MKEAVIDRAQHKDSLPARMWRVLVRRGPTRIRKSTVAETERQIPGAASLYYAPGAKTPIILPQTPHGKQRSVLGVIGG